MRAAKRLQPGVLVLTLRLCALLLAALVLSRATRIWASAPKATVVASRQLQSWSLEAPTGPYSIGSVTLHLIDRLRWDPLAPVHRRRELMVQIWYPTVSPRTRRRAAYVKLGVARVLERELEVPIGSFEAVRSRAWEGLPPARIAHSPLRIILYSPGYGSWRNASTVLVEELVSHGFAVVTIDHPYDGEAVEFPNGAIARAKRLPSPRNPAKDPLAQWESDVGLRLNVRVADARFVLDSLAAINAGKNPDAEHRPLPALRGALDLAKIGMFGHSLGASTTVLVMRSDPRVRAGFMMDGPIPAAARHGNFYAPLLLVRSENAGVGRLVGPSWKQFQPALRGWHRTFTLPRSSHNDFTDLTLIARHMHLPASLRSSWLLGTIDGRQAVDQVRGLVTRFFDRQLR